MDFLEELKADHGRFRAALERLRRLPARAAADALGRLSPLMRAHQDQERKRLFPAIRQRAPACAPILDAMIREHSRLEQLLSQARALAPSPTRRSAHRCVAALKAFDDAFLRHLDREETELFSLATTGFTRGELEDLAHEEEPEFVDLGVGD